MKFGISISAVLFLLWAAYAISPFIGVYRLVSVVQERNVAALRDRVDFPALRKSLTTQIVKAYLTVTGKIRQTDSLLDQLAVNVAASIADPMVAKLISPESLLDLLQNGRPSDAFSDSVPSTGVLTPEALGNFWRAYLNSELGIGRFFLDVPVDKRQGESFLRDWTWKLCGTQLPEPLQIRLAQELVKSEQR
jgi:hypothetical protein